VDSAGNYGPPGNISATVSQPPDYILLYNYNSTFGGTQVNTLIDGDGGLILPVDITSTYEQHFTNNRVVTASALDLNSWTKSGAASFTANATDDKNGNVMAFTLGPTTTGDANLSKVVSGLTASTQYNFSIELRQRAGKGDGLVNLLIKSADGVTTYFTASVTATASWVRYTVTGTLAAGVTSVQLVVDPTTNSGNSGFLIDLNNPQIATGATPLPYWGTPQDQVNAGFPLFIEPGALSASYTEVIDYGTHLPSTKFTVTPTTVIMDGAPGLSCDIQVSLDNVTWVDYPGVFQTFVTNFRYAKVQITATGAGADIMKFTNLNIRFDVKQKTDGGIVPCLSTDVGGTKAYFTAGFIDVQSLTVTGQGTVAAFAIYDFVDVPYPDHFSIYLFDKNGNRLSGNASWAARGV
jgi:hypothetical protein